MRAYFFGNFYLSSIQQGIQSAHVVHDMFVKYVGNPTEESLWEWAEHHKTMILLNGGMASDLLTIETMLNNNANPYPWAAFREEEAALNNSITSVGVVLPSKIYEGAALMRSIGWSLNDLSDADGVLNLPGPGMTQTAERYTRFDGLLMQRMNQCGLAK